MATSNWLKNERESVGPKFDRRISAPRKAKPPVRVVSEKAAAMAAETQEDRAALLAAFQEEK